MRIAALYDIHGNLPALEAVLADAEGAGAELFVVGGDVAPGPLAVETLDALAALGDRVRWVRGNGERELAAAHERWAAGIAAGDEEPATRWLAGRLASRHRALLATLPVAWRADVDGLGSALFCHGSPRSDEEILTALTADEGLAAALAAGEADVVVAGHTHVQFDRTVAGCRLVNAGSVGLPYEDVAAAYWALLGPDVELRRTEYDVEAALARMRASGYPDLDEAFSGSLIDPVGARAASEHFTRLADAREPPPG